MAGAFGGDPAQEHVDDHDPDAVEGALWVEQHLDVARNTYRPVLRFRDDVVPLTPKVALAWAQDVLDAAHAAAYDAAVMAQVRTALDLPITVAGEVVKELRADRAPRRTLQALPDIDLTPGVAAASGQPFLILTWRGKPLGQWTVDAARGHALHLLESVVVADLDSTYYRLLRNRFEAEPGPASAMVHDLVNFRDPETQRGVPVGGGRS